MTDQPVKTTPFVNVHKALGAKMVPFAGFLMPVEYSGINVEHQTVRENVGIFDVSHMGEIWVKGDKALDLVQWVTSNDASKLKPGQIQYSCFPNGKGGIVDDLLVYMYDSKKFLLVVNASNIDKDYNWLVSQNKFGVEIENSSDNIGQLAIQGPKATELLQNLTSVDLKTIPYYTFVTGNFAGCNDVIISNTGYTGSGGFEIYFYNRDAKKVWDAIFAIGEKYGLKPIGLGARDTLRLEMGYNLYGNDIDDTTSPIEAGLGWITKFTDSKDFVDKELLLKQKNVGISKKLVGFEMVDKAIPRHGYNITDESGKAIGIVTSGTMSPTMKIGIGMGYVPTALAEVGSTVYVEIRGKLQKAKVVKMPFYKGGIK
ncbi:MAG TPA: glycine cleavage system aminomethyltransferase GcvT [Bacteroidales bacterium]|nr:glycine cleavage system aminomethyltransferase GcvT [Bacteroidales bacterium]